MLNLFGNLFGHGHEAHSALPEPLIKQLIERAVDSTDPRMRIVSGYAKFLRKPVIHAAEHVIALIDRLPEPLPLEPDLQRGSPTLASFLYSPVEAARILARDAALAEYRATKPPATLATTVLLVLQRSEKHGFGYAQVGDQAVADVPKTTVSFSDHHLLEPAASEEDTRRGLKRRAFDQVLAVALTTITGRNETRKELVTQQALLRSKLDILQRSGSFTKHTSADDRGRLQARMAEIEQKLAALGPSTEVLQANLEVVADTLANAERHLWLEESTLYLDKFYVLHDKPAPSVPAIHCRDLHNSQGRQVSLQLVTLPPA